MNVLLPLETYHNADSQKSTNYLKFKTKLVKESPNLFYICFPTTKPHLTPYLMDVSKKGYENNFAEATK